MKFVTGVAEAEYTAFVSSNPKAHFLQSYAWGELSRMNGFTPHYVMAYTDSGVPCAAALLLQKILPAGCSYFYIPRGFTADYSDKNLLNDFTRQLAAYTRRFGSIFFTIDPDIPLRDIDSDGMEISGGENNFRIVDNIVSSGYIHIPLTYFFETNQPRYTFRIDITPAVDDIRKRYSSSAKKSLKIADKYHITTNRGTADDIGEFVRIMRLTEKRQEFYQHDELFYRRFFETFNRAVDCGASLFLAKLDIDANIKQLREKITAAQSDVALDADPSAHNSPTAHLNRLREELALFEKAAEEGDASRVVSVAMNVDFGDKSWCLYAGNDLDFAKAYANYKLYDYQITEAKARGKEIFDQFGTIGRPNADTHLRGLHEFKSRFGGIYTEFVGEFDYIQRPVMYRLYKFIAPLRRKMSRRRLHKMVRESGDEK